MSLKKGSGGTTYVCFILLICLFAVMDRVLEAASQYPNATDTFVYKLNKYGDRPVTPSVASRQNYYAEDLNDIFDYVLKVQEVLGINPQGVYSTVNARFASIAFEVGSQAILIASQTVALAITEAGVGTLTLQVASLTQHLDIVASEVILLNASMTFTQLQITDLQASDVVLLATTMSNTFLISDNTASISTNSLALVDAAASDVLRTQAIDAIVASRTIDEVAIASNTEHRLAVANNPHDVLASDVHNYDPLWNASKLFNVVLSSTTPTINYVIKFDGTKWGPASDTSGTDDIDADSLQGTPISTASPTLGQALLYDGTNWLASTLVQIGLHNNFPDLQGGIASERVHLTYAEIASLPANLMLVDGDILTRNNDTLYALPKGANGTYLGVASDGFLAYSNIVSDNSDAISLQGTPINNASPTSGQLLVFGGTEWVSTNTAQIGLHNNFPDLQGGIASERVHLSYAEIASLPAALLLAEGDILVMQNSKLVALPKGVDNTYLGINGGLLGYSSVVDVSGSTSMRLFHRSGYAAALANAASVSSGTFSTYDIQEYAGHATTTFLYGKNTFKVWRNGLRMTKGIDYVETNNHTITFLYTLNSDDIVILAEAIFTNASDLAAMLATDGDAWTIQGTPVNNASPTVGQLMIFNGVEWVASTSAGFTGDAVSIQGIAVATTTPTIGQALLYDGAEWTASSTVNTGGAIGDAVSIQGTPVSTASPTEAQLMHIVDGVWTPASISEFSLATPAMRILHIADYAVNVANANSIASGNYNIFDIREVPAYATDSYLVGQNTLKVYRNGFLLANTIDYVETNEYTITLNYPILSDDIIIIKEDILFDAANVPVATFSVDSINGLTGDVVVGNGTNTTARVQGGILYVDVAFITFTERFTGASFTTQIYTLVGTHSYVIGSEQIMLWRNGILQAPIDDYIETASTSIQAVGYTPQNSDKFFLRRF